MARNAPHRPPELVTTGSALEELVGELLGAPRYALDTEFHRERTYWPRLALVQVALELPEAPQARVALVDPQAVDVSALAKVLTGPGVMVAHAASADIEVLWRACEALPARLFDTQVAGGFLGHSSASLARLAEAFLGVKIAKADRLSDWSRRPLTSSQVGYAAADVAHLLRLADALSVELRRRGRLAWAEEESALLVRRPPFPPDPREAWWKLPDNRSLQGSSRAVAQEVAAWREMKARERDVLPRSVLPDLALLSIAHSPPKTLAALREVRGIDARHLKEGADEEILAAVARGQELPAEMLRLPKAEQLDKRLRPAVALATAWVAQLAKDEGIDAALLATRADIVAWLQGRASKLGRGWRAGLVGEPLARLARGEVALAIDGAGNLLMEPRARRPG